MKQKSFSFNFEQFTSETEIVNAARDKTTSQDTPLRTSVFTLGKDVATPQEHLSPPEITDLQILKDGLDNPYIQINWQLPRADVDSGNVVGFQIYRRTKRSEESTSFFAVKSFDRNAFNLISQKNKDLGKFSEEKKAFNNINLGLIDQSNLNNNLFLEKLASRTRVYNNQGTIAPDQAIVNNSFSPSLDKNDFILLATVDYSQFLIQEKRKFLFVQDRNFATLLYNDRNVSYRRYI